MAHSSGASCCSSSDAGISLCDASGIGAFGECEERVGVGSASCSEFVDAASHIKSIDAASHTKSINTASHIKSIDATSHTKSIDAASHTKSIDAASHTESTNTASHTESINTASHTKSINTASHTKSATIFSPTTTATHTIWSPLHNSSSVCAKRAGASSSILCRSANRLDLLAHHAHRSPDKRAQEQGERLRDV